MMTQLNSILTAIIFVLSSFALISCSNSQEGGLITDAIPLTDCPQNSCAQGIADPAETKVVLQTPINNALPTGNSFAEVAGDCYASLYPTNFFEVSVTFNGAEIGGFRNNQIIGRIFPTGYVPRCNQGKFYFPVNLEGRGNGAYVLSAQLVVTDSNGISIRPPFKVIQSTLIKQ